MRWINFSSGKCGECSVAYRHTLVVGGDEVSGGDRPGCVVRTLHVKVELHRTVLASVHTCSPSKGRGMGVHY